MPCLKNLTIACALAIGAVSNAHSQSSDCVGFESVGPEATLSLGTVNDSAPKTFFVKGAGLQKSCPNDSAACREKAYLVPGDQVIVSAVGKNFVCGEYVNAKGLVRAGWLPASAITLVPEAAPAGPADWIGRWTGGPEQSISIEKGSQPGLVRIKGDATYGALDPDRVRRGAVNIGEIEASVKPDRSFLAFTMGDSATLPYSEGDEYDCRVRMRLLGQFLLVEDNRNCGGMNVSFAGAYRRKK